MVDISLGEVGAMMRRGKMVRKKKKKSVVSRRTMKDGGQLSFAEAERLVEKERYVWKGGMLRKGDVDEDETL
jgi:hypothetical protein